MAALRRSNAAHNRTRKPVSRPGAPSPSRTLGSLRGTTAGDIVGVLLMVLAMALAVSVVAPSDAIVTQACGQALHLCFGAGALLCPVAVAVLALTFFVPDDGPLSGHIALGVLLIALAILGLLSINSYVVGVKPPAVLLDEVAKEFGGYVGGALALLLLESVGQVIGNIVLVGLAIVGVVVCGFSVSRLVERLQGSLGSARRRIAARRRPVDLEGPLDDGLPDAVAQREDVAQTTFLGSRKTTVLRRGRPEAPEEAPTRLLRHRHPDIDVATSEPAATTAVIAGEGALDVASDLPGQPAVPPFLEDAAARSLARGRRGTPRKHAAAQTPSCTTSRARAEAPARPVSAAAKAKTSRPGDDADGYELPRFSMLSSNPNSAASASSKEELDQTRARLQGTLEEFGLTGRVVDYVSGPLVTTFRVEMGEGERVNRIRNLEDDIALTLAAEKVRIFAPIPGTSYVGIEIPNKSRQNVHLGDVLPFAAGGPLEVAIGRDSAGRPVIADIAKMPHMLVAGTTGSGKSVMINSMIMSLLMRTTPKQVRLIMIDPKRVEFSAYNGLPHLYVPVVTEPRQAASALAWAVSEMERRLKVFQKAGARDIKVYNRLCKDGALAKMDNPPEPMPFLVVIIDELSDLMMVAGKDVEASIVRIAQLARAAGIHLVIATQRPSANVVTGLIKSNIDSRVALKVSSGIDSRVILDETGAERLLGNGDMLFKDRGLSPRRVLGCYTSDREINDVVEFIRAQAAPDYHEEILSQIVPGQPGASGAGMGEEDEADDPLLWEAASIVVDSQLGSTSGLQRRLKVGYARAGRIMDMLEAKGVVGPPDGSKPREVLLDKDSLEQLKTQEAAFRGV
ncbi:DNA translocase FtsK [Olsenella massiliensis]|uniref:DNA translocase FtsK n=1 Tax=Olsenella massiliensis TaxID=1622075 RepID=UPI00071D284E|nr:DNA translocase FtsK [Olsenella massiliensis]